MTIGLFKVGGSSCSCLPNIKYDCNNKMQFTYHLNNDFFYKPGNTASWSRRSKSGGGQNWGKKVATKIGSNRLGGCQKN